jgi:hypothetical protein
METTKMPHCWWMDQKNVKEKPTSQAYWLYVYGFHQSLTQELEQSTIVVVILGKVLLQEAPD